MLFGAYAGVNFHPETLECKFWYLCGLWVFDMRIFDGQKIRRKRPTCLNFGGRVRHHHAALIWLLSLLLMAIGSLWHIFKFHAPVFYQRVASMYWFCMPGSRLFRFS